MVAKYENNGKNGILNSRNIIITTLFNKNGIGEQDVVQDGPPVI